MSVHKELVALIDQRIEEKLAERARAELASIRKAMEASFRANDLTVDCSNWERDETEATQQLAQMFHDAVDQQSLRPDQPFHVQVGLQDREHRVGHVWRFVERYRELARVLRFGRNVSDVEPGVERLAHGFAPSVGPDGSVGGRRPRGSTPTGDPTPGGAS